MKHVARVGSKDETARPPNVVRRNEDDHLIMALLMIHCFIMASLTKSLQGFQMWFVLMIIVFVMMMLNYNGEEGDPSLLIHNDDQGDGDGGKTVSCASVLFE